MFHMMHLDSTGAGIHLLQSQSEREMAISRGDDCCSMIDTPGHSSGAETLSAWLNVLRAGSDGEPPDGADVLGVLPGEADAPDIAHLFASVANHRILCTAEVENLDVEVQSTCDRHLFYTTQCECPPQAPPPESPPPPPPPPPRRGDGQQGGGDDGPPSPGGGTGTVDPNDEPASGKTNIATTITVGGVMFCIAVVAAIVTYRHGRKTAFAAYRQLLDGVGSDLLGAAGAGDGTPGGEAQAAALNPPGRRVTFSVNPLAADNL